jgi:hypothetical protein
MLEANVRRQRTAPRFAAALRLAAAILLAVPVALVAQAPQGRGAGGGGAAAPAPGQGRGGPAAPGAGRGAAASARAAAPVDLTGYWVSIVTEDWIERMAPDSPPSGVGRGGRGQFDGGGPAPGAPASAASGDPCRAYGAAGSLRIPGRLNITWTDDNTLKIDLDAGKQTRLLHFGAAPAPPQRTLQGHSVATWNTGARGRGGRGGPGGGAAAPPAWGSLQVVTTNMTNGYLLSSRAPYSENAVLTEHFTRHADFGTEYFTVTAIVADGPTTRISSSTFKKEPNGSRFSPTGCEVVR